MARIDPATLKAAKERVSINSVLVPAWLMPYHQINSIRQAALNSLLVAAHEGMVAGHKITVRDLRPTDVGLTNDVWQETTGATANTWENSAVAGGTTYTIADDRFIVIWGLTYNLKDGDTPAVAAVRLEIGGSKVAIWHLDKLLQCQNKTAITLSPIIICQSIEIKIEHYVKVASAGVEIIYDGACAEKEGKLLRP